MPDQTKPAARDGVARHILLGFLCLGLLFGGAGGWAATFSISGAVVASGVVTVEGNSKRVQHPEGGVVSAIHVRDGDRVAAGGLLLRLDDTAIRANLQMIEHQLATLTARRGRLIAERSGAEAIPEMLALGQGAADAVLQQAVAGELNLFQARRQAREGQLGQLTERLAQLADERGGLHAQLEAKRAELKLIIPELAKLEDMLARGLVTANRVLALRRERARLEGEEGRLTAEIAGSGSRSSEINVQILQIGHDARAEIEKELRETESAIAELGEKKIAAEDRLRRVDVRAPREGVVASSTVHTVGGVVAAGETMLMIVPSQDAFVVEARVAPTDIDQLSLGQSATIRLSALSQRTTPELDGTVERIAAEASRDEKTGAEYYPVRVTLAPEQLARLGGIRLTASMPVEIFARTRERTLLSYLVKPLADQLARAMRHG